MFGFALLGLSLLCGLAVLAILAFIFWIWAIVNVATAKNKGDWKLIWILVVILLGIIGAVVYFFAGKPERKG